MVIIKPFACSTCTGRPYAVGGAACLADLNRVASTKKTANKEKRSIHRSNIMLT